MSEEILEETVVTEADIVEQVIEEPEKPARAVRKPRKKYQVVKALRIAHGNVLLEWEKDGLLDRCYLPLSVVEHAEVGKFVSVEVGELAKGAPFGDDLTPFLVAQAPRPARIQDMLRRRGVWRREEILQQSGVVRSTLQALYQLDVVKIQGRVKESIARE